MKAIQGMLRWLALFVVAVAAWGTAAAAGPLEVVVLGDSLTAGFGLDPAEAFPARLQDVLVSRGHDVAVVNAGVSGDTASDGLARVDWSVGEDADAVIVELGANDALRGIDPDITREGLDALLLRLEERGLPVLLAGMKAPRNLGPSYVAAFDAIYPELAARHDVLLYPFFLDGVAARRDLNQPDGIHPNAAGVDVVVAGMVPAVEALIDRVGAARQLVDR